MADIPLAGRQVTEAFDAVGGAIGNLGRAMQDRELLTQDIIEYLSQEHLFGEKEWFGGWDDFTLNQVNEAEGHTVTVTKGGKKYKLRAGENFADWRRNDKPVPPTSSPAPAPSSAPPDPETTSRLRGTLAGETAAPTTKPIQMDMYHGGVGIDKGLVDPAKHSTGRTPLPALTVSDEAVARSYATTGGVGRTSAYAGARTYKLGLQFDSPERIVGAYDPASDDFINFMRNSLPEEGVPNYNNEIEIKAQGGRTVRFRDIFDEKIMNLDPDDRSIYAVMDALSDVHEFYRPLENYDYKPRAQGSIEARRFGIDALTWSDYGDEVIGLLDPHDVRSQTGRVNITSIDDVTENLPPASPVDPEPTSSLKGSLAEETLTPAPVAQPVDFNDPSTWRTVGPDKVDVGRPLPVSEAQAATLKYGKYRDAAHRTSETVDASGNRVRNQTLGNIESEMSSFHTGSAINLGYEGRAIAKPEFQKNYQDVMSKIYKDISEGIDPMTALRNHINDYDIPDDIRETIVKRVQEAELNAVKTGEVTMTPYRQLTEDEYVSRMNDTRRATASESTIDSYGDDLIEPEITTRVSDPSGEEYRAARARGERIVTEPYSHAEAVATSSVDDVARPGPGLKVGETVDLPVVHSARDTAEKLSATARVADAVASDGGPAKAAAAVASAAAAVVAGPAAPASARAASSTASSLAAGSNLAKMVTKGPAGAIALGVAAAGLLIGKSVQSNKRADRSAQMNVQQRYGR